jgi:hypothetical protein
LPPPPKPRVHFLRWLMYVLVIGIAGGVAAAWFVGLPQAWLGVISSRLDGVDPRLLRLLPALRHGHPLPNLGWSGWAMLGSMLVIVPLVLFLRGSDPRVNVLQRCLVLSVLFHALLSFGLSSIVVTQHVSSYVKQETGVDLSLTLPKSVELVLSLRNPRSSEGPQATAPRDLDPALNPIQEPHAPTAVPVDVPLDTAVSGRGSLASIMKPPLAISAPPPPNAPGVVALVPVPAPPDASLLNIPLPSPVSQQELQPSVSIPGPQVLLKSGIDSLALPSFASHGVTLQTGGESAADHIDSLAAPAPLPSPQVIAPPISGGASATASVAAGPQISPPPALLPKVSAGPSSDLLGGADPGSGDDAELGRSPANGAGEPGARFAPMREGPRDLAGSIGTGADAGPATAMPPEKSSAVAAPAPIQIAKLNDDDLVIPHVPLIPPPPVAPTVHRAMVAVTPFQRAPEQRKGRIATLGGTPQSEEAVEHALRFLARQQEPDGRWTQVSEESLPGKRAYNPHDMAYTGLALLTFLARDNSPFQPGRYRQTIRKGLNYLLTNQSEDGDLRGPPEFRGPASQQANLYDHAIAMLAISECALLTGDARLASSSRAAARFIVNAQDTDGGGWRYAPGQTGDTSVFGWEIMALHTAELLGFQIPADTRRLAHHYIDTACSGPRNVLAGYQPGVDPTQTMTSEMIFARILLGEHLSDAEVRDATEFLSQYSPEAAHPDLYCWYYASLCMLQMNSPAWSQWNARTRDTLIQLQTRGGFADGCWEINAKGIDRSGYIFTTAIATLTLEVYYRYAPGLAEAAR